jgi:hypothetical protein
MISKAVNIRDTTPAAEAAIDRLSHALLAFIKDNKKFIKTMLSIIWDEDL